MNKVQFGTKPQTNGIYDGMKSSPTIFALPNGGMDYIVNITDDFDTPDCYSEVVALLNSATENDTIKFNICSSGGYLKSLNMLLGFKQMCPARQEHILFSEASSAATAFFLSDADKYIIGDRASFMIHEIQFGSGGTSSNVQRHTSHVFKENEDFVRETYSNFLSEQEVKDVLRGVELYIGANEIRERLQKRELLKQQQLQAEQPPADVDLSEFSLEDLQEELEAMSEDRKVLQAEIKKRTSGKVTNKTK